MKRRTFIKGTTQATLALTASSLPLGADAKIVEKSGSSFRLDYAPHDGMFVHHAGDDIVDQIEYMHQQGFRSFEDNEMRNRSVEVQSKIGASLASLGMRMGVFVAHEVPWQSAALAAGDTQAHEAFLSGIKDSVRIAQRCNAKWMTVVPGLRDPRMPIGYQNAHIITLLRRACDILEESELVMVLEPLNPYVNHPGLFLATSPHAYQICKAVDHPSCKILFDIYHQQITEGNIINNINACWDEIAYFQIGDTPGRNEPTTGELNYKNIFSHIHSKGYKGILGMEHGNSQAGKEGEKRVIDAYRECDSF